MHFLAYSVTDVLFHHEIACPFNGGLDSIAYVAYSVALYRLLNTLVKSRFRCLQKPFLCFAYLSYPESLGVVAHIAVQLRHYIAGKDIALFKNFLLGGNAVDKLAVYGEAVVPGEPPVALAGRVSAVGDNVLVHKSVKLPGGDTHHCVFACVLQSSCCQLTRFDHFSDLCC